MFRIGQKVVCVEGWDGPFFSLKKDEIYTISGYGKFVESWLYDVAEVKTITPHAWSGRRFRPAVETNTDISISTKMLKPQDQKEDA